MLGEWHLSRKVRTEGCRECSKSGYRGKWREGYLSSVSGRSSKSTTSSSMGGSHCVTPQWPIQCVPGAGRAEAREALSCHSRPQAQEGLKD